MTESLAKLRRILAVLTITAVPAASTARAEVPGEAPIDNGRFVYSTEEKLGFDLEEYLGQAAPHLLPQVEAIYHWSGYTTVSPRIALALMELRSRQLSGGPAKAGEPPFGELSDKADFSAQVADVLGRLAAAFYASPAGAGGLRVAPAARDALRSVLGEGFDFDGLAAAYARLFPAEPPLHQALPEPAADKAVPPSNYLQLPYPVGESWFHGGTHTNTGIDPGPPSALDFLLDFRPFGADTGNIRVVAAHPGTTRVYSSCNVEVLGSGGWSTSYYHLDHVVVADGHSVGRDQRLSGYADNLAQALCQGGHSNLPHVHFALRRNGQYVSLQDVRLSGYRVEAGRFSYDEDCNFFWLERDGVRHCAFAAPVFNDGVTVRPAAPSGLTAEALSAASIRLRWTDRSGDESGFEIERRVEGGGGFSRIATVGADAVEYVSTGLQAATTYLFRVRAVNVAGASGYAGEARATTSVADPEPCAVGGEAPCLAGRFEVEVTWKDHAGDVGTARKVVESDDSAVVWFFDSDNWEMLIKVLDGCGFNGHYWVFAAATTDVQYTLKVVDTATGRAAAYYNPLGNAAAAVTDTSAFACPSP